MRGREQRQKLHTEEKTMKVTIIFSVYLLLLVPGIIPEGEGLRKPLPIKISVVNSIMNTGDVTYHSTVAEGGNLLGAMRRLQETNEDFKFTIKEHTDFGPFLESVNGVAGSDADQTYWEILTEDSSHESRLDVGVGCYIPKVDEHIILKFTTWTKA